MTPRSLRAPAYALAVVDAEHVVAVGPRGHILRSADRGKTWEQRPAERRMWPRGPTATTCSASTTASA